MLAFQTMTFDMALSQRGQQYAAPANKNKLLDILSDVWHPTNNPEGYISLGVAENSLMHLELLQHINQNLSITHSSLGYGDSFSGSHGLKKALASFLEKHFHAVGPVLPSHLAITSGVSSAIEACAFSVGDPGDGVLLGRPFYKAFPYNLRNRAGLQPVFVSFEDGDPFGEDSVRSYEDALLKARIQGIRVRAFLLCNPHNPLGICASRQYNLHMISDEIYGLSSWNNSSTPDAPSFHSMLSFDIRGLIDPSLVHVLWGMSKDFGMSGVRLGCVVSQNNPDLIQSIATNSIFTCPSSIADSIAEFTLRNKVFVNTFARLNRERLCARYTEATSLLARNGISYKQSNAAFFVWADLFSFRSSRNEMKPRSSGRGDEELEHRLNAHLLAHKVFIANGSSFGHEEAGWFRITFALDSEYLARGLERMLDALRSFEA
ncbi:putative 1-aminocyclopropane-1-carboxylate synthase [Plectosphaerella plurivora]|uniref:1-aminocyclopropane-1-carboxylate synthase n=1 Tax=Plectosphaerella plurivora TaxID=936078 RepID=A0A9P8VDF9_9PEZI|nr:putative 1-aminocyclopropane-1-carboxylate synthase [Plectosphaerella plurivora]